MKELSIPIALMALVQSLLYSSKISAHPFFISTAPESAPKFLTQNLTEGGSFTCRRTDTDILFRWGEHDYGDWPTDRFPLLVAKAAADFRREQPSGPTGHQQRVPKGTYDYNFSFRGPAQRIRIVIDEYEYKQPTEVLRYQDVDKTIGCMTNYVNFRTWGDTIPGADIEIYHNSDPVMMVACGSISNTLTYTLGITSDVESDDDILRQQPNVKSGFT